MNSAAAITSSPFGSPGETPTNVRYVILAALCSLAFITYLDRVCISRVQGDIARDLNLGALDPEDEARLLTLPTEQAEKERKILKDQLIDQRMGWVFAAFLWGYVIMEIPAGWLGDVWGARSVIFRIVVWWSAFTALTGSIDKVVGWFVASPTPWLLTWSMVAVRFLFGLGEAGAYPNISRVLSRWFPFKDRAFAQGSIWMCSRAGGAVAPLTIGLLTEYVGGWRQAFWLLGLIGAAWAVWFYFWFRELPDQMRGVNQAEIDLIRGAGGKDSIYDDHSHSAVPWKSMFTSVNLWSLFLASSCASFCWYFNVTFLPKYLKDQFGVEFAKSQWMAGLPLLAGALACFAGGGLSDWLIRRLGSRRLGRSLPGAFGYVFAGLSTLAIPHVAEWVRTSSVNSSPEDAGYYAACGAVFCICCALAFQDLAMAALWSLMADLGGRYAGTLAGTMNAVTNIGGSIGIPLAPAIKNHFNDWNAVFAINGCVYILGGLLWLRVNANEPLLGEPESIAPS